MSAPHPMIPCAPKKVSPVLRSRIRFALFATVFCIAVFAGSHLPTYAEAGAALTPATAIEIGTDEISSGVSKSAYYFIVASRDGILDVSLVPVTGEVDLAVIAFSGSPSIESRKEGMAREEISLRVSKGEKYLIRIMSPFGRSATFRLRASISSPDMTGRGESGNADRSASAGARDGRSEAGAVIVELGRTIAVEATGRRFFKVAVPEGYVLSVSVYPVARDVDLLVQMADASPGLAMGSGTAGSVSSSASSQRRGMLAEHVYVPMRMSGDVVVQVFAASIGAVGDADPRDESLERYVLVTRLRAAGITTLATASEPEPDPRLSDLPFSDDVVGRGIPGMGEIGKDISVEGERGRMRSNGSKLLRLP